MPGPIELEDEVRRLAAESLAVRTILAHLLARLSAVADPEIAAAIRRGLEDSERALRERAAEAGDKATALAVVEAVKAAMLRAALEPSGGVKEEPGAFHAVSPTISGRRTITDCGWSFGFSWWTSANATGRHNGGLRLPTRASS